MSLDELLAQADSTSVTLRAARNGLQAACESATTADRATMLPNLVFSAAAGYLGDGYGWGRDSNYSFTVPMPHFSTHFRHLSVILFALLLLKDFRFQPMVPLKGIDWTGMALWSVFLVALTALFVYGEEQAMKQKPVTASERHINDTSTIHQRYIND